MPALTNHLAREILRINFRGLFFLKTLGREANWREGHCGVMERAWAGSPSHLGPNGYDLVKLLHPTESQPPQLKNTHNTIYLIILPRGTNYIEDLK